MDVLPLYANDDNPDPLAVIKFFTLVILDLVVRL